MRSYIRNLGTNALYNEGEEFVAGQSMMFNGPVDKIPAGWMVEDGSAISRTAYATLFAVIGVTYGPGDGVNTFNVPDSRGEFWRGLDMWRGVDAGRTLGSAQADMLRSHTHAQDAATLTSKVGGAITYSETVNNRALGGTTGSAGGVETRPRNVPKIPIIKYS